MTPSKTRSLKFVWIACVVLGLIAVSAGVAYKLTHPQSTAGEGAKGGKDTAKKPVPVKVVMPVAGIVPRQCIQPGSVLAYESVRLFSEVPGFLKFQGVNIGYRVTKDQVLAIVDVPELRAQEKKDLAALDRGAARIRQMNARVTSASADKDAAQAVVTQSEALVKSAKAWKEYRGLQASRYKQLADDKQLEQKVYDESYANYLAAVEAEFAADAAVSTARAKVEAASAKIEQARADVAEAEADLEVARAELLKVRELIKFATIVAPFDGIVTYRGEFPRGFVRAANASGSNDHLLTVHRADKMTVVVLVPDRDAPFVKANEDIDPFLGAGTASLLGSPTMAGPLLAATVLTAEKGSKVSVTFDSLPGPPVTGVVTRKAKTLDLQTRLMRVEIDLLNPTPNGELTQGMYGQATLLLDEGKNDLSIPSSCLVNKKDNGQAEIFVVQEGKAKKKSVRCGTDNGVRVVILGKDLTRADQVIVQPSISLTDGAEVSAVVETTKE